jgi:hypothetical protein
VEAFLECSECCVKCRKRRPFPILIQTVPFFFLAAHMLDGLPAMQKIQECPLWTPYAVKKQIRALPGQSSKMHDPSKCIGFCLSRPYAFGGVLLYKVVDFAASTLMSASAGILSTPFLPRTPAVGFGISLFNWNLTSSFLA